MGVLYTAIVVNSVPRAKVLNSDVAVRKYKGFSLITQIADDLSAGMTYYQIKEVGTNE